MVLVVVPVGTWCWDPHTQDLWLWVPAMTIAEGKQMFISLTRQLSVLVLACAAIAGGLSAQSTDPGVDLTLNGGHNGVTLQGNQPLTIVAQSTLPQSSMVFIVGSLASPTAGLSIDSLVILASQTVAPLGNIQLGFTTPIDNGYGEVLRLRLALQAFALSPSGQLVSSPIRLVKLL